MRFCAAAALVLFSIGCKPREMAPAAPAPVIRGDHPEVIPHEGALHAVKCGAVTAVWTGDLEEQKEYGVKQLTFLVGGEKLVAPSEAALGFADHTFQVFSPDCSHLALLQDHYGPIHLVKVSELAGYLKGTATPRVLAAINDSGTAGVVGQLTWTSGSTLEFVSSCCGGAEAFKAGAEGGVERISFVASAPKGVRRTKDGRWEAVP